MIDKTYVINLSRCINKKIHMENEFSKLKEKGIELNHVFFNAIDGNDNGIISKYEFKIPNWCDPNSGKVMTNGEVGCALSHYLVWKDIITSVENKSLSENCKILILEDDVVFVDNFMDKLKSYTGEIDFVYDMLYVHRKPLNLESETKLSLHINSIKKSYWACGYILTFNGAKKLVNANYLNNLIPVDEFLPIMYGCNVMGFEKLFEKFEKISCYAICPNLLKLTRDAFYNSETFHSQPFIGNNKFTFNGNKEFKIIYIGPVYGDSYARFESYCKLYGLPYYTINNTNQNIPQIKLLANEFATWSNEQIESTLLMVLSVDQNDTCGILPIASSSEIIEKYTNLISNSNSDPNSNTNYIVTYKKDNDGKILFMGWTNQIMKLLDVFSEKLNSTNNNVSFTMLLTIGSFINNNIMIDSEYDIFQPLNENISITFNHRTSRIVNQETKTIPCIIFSTDAKSSIILNRIENYTGNGWNEYYGYHVSDNAHNTNKLPHVYLSFNLGNNKHILGILNTLNYPRELLTVKINHVGKSNDKTMILYDNENDLYQKDLLNFIDSGCDYYFFINKDCVIMNPNVINELLNFDKNIIAPFIRRGNDAWTNFWGDLDNKGFYKRSYDYFDIIEGKKQGCWNVPYITGTYLIKRKIIELVPNLFTENMDMDIDMRLCHNLRMHNIFMYITNLSYFGSILNIEDESTTENLTENISENISETNNGELTLYDILTRREEWEKKYLHPEYYQNKNNLGKLRCIEICNDIYSFPLFSQDFCTEIMERADKYGKWSNGNNEHNDPRLGKNYYENVPTVDIQLFELQMDKQWYEIVFSYIAPMAKFLYNNYKTKDINLAFIVKYTVENQAALAPHHDASTYTINVALNRGNGVDYNGGGCRFIRQNFILRNQEPGMCSIHAGRLTAYHEGLPVTFGKRYILVSFIN